MKGARSRMALLSSKEGAFIELQECENPKIAKTPEEKAEVYFRTTPMFETGDERYLWLNDIVAVGLGASIGGAVRYDIFELL